MAWRNATASMTLVNAINAKWPRRSKISDGTIGDAAHATRSSDHNPWVKVGGVGVVRARDITADGIDASWLAEQLRIAGMNGDGRLRNGGYIIFKGRITSPDFRSWRVYTGSNGHYKHVHVSFARDAGGFDNGSGWAFLSGAGGAIGTPNTTQGDDDLPSVREVWEHRIGLRNERGQLTGETRTAEAIMSDIRGFTDRAVPAIVNAILDAPVDRKDQNKGPTTLRAQLAWEDAHVDSIVANVKKEVAKLSRGVL